MKLFINLSIAVLLVSGCVSIPKAEIDNATLYFPQTFKYIEKPEYSFSDAERLRTLQALAVMKVDILFEIIDIMEMLLRLASFVRG